MLMVAMLLGLSSAAWAEGGSEVPHFPMDFGSNYAGDDGTTSVSVGGSILAISMKHGEGSDETYLVDVQSGTVTDPAGTVMTPGDEPFTDTMNQVYSILNTVKVANPGDADKIESAISYLHSWH